ncbi:MAG: 30S ribosomal protein S16 [Candidatus Doudnabacteria bacterium]
MLTIRLQRTGTKNKPDFRIVLAQSYRSASKKVLEVLGHYNPRSKNFGIKDQERLTYWLDKHVQVSPTVYNLFVDKKIVTGKKVKAWQPRKKEGEAATVPAAPAAAASAEVEVKA